MESYKSEESITKMEEISLRNEALQKNNDNAFVAANGSIFRLKLLNILLGVCLICLGVALFAGYFLYILCKLELETKLSSNFPSSDLW